MKKISIAAMMAWVAIFCSYSQIVDDQLASQIGRSQGTEATMAGYWTRMATCTNNGGWEDFGTVFELMGNGSANNQYYFGKLIARFKRQDIAPGPATNVSLVLLDSNIGAENIKGIGNGSTIDIFVRINAAYTNMHYRRIVGANSLITLLNNEPLISDLPQGRRIDCEEWEGSGNKNLNGRMIQLKDGEQHTEITSDIMGRCHEIVFGASRSKSCDWLTNSMVYSSEAGDYNYGAGAIRYVGNGGQLDFYISNQSTGVGQKVEWGISKMTILRNGNVGIGKTPEGSNKLDVSGTIRATEIKVEAATTAQLNVDGTLHANTIKVAANGQTADFVFSDDYNLKELSEVEQFIKQNKHLPNIPSAAQMEANGVDLAEMNKLLLQKVEELTLYTIDKEKEVEGLKLKMESQEMRLKKLEELLEPLSAR